jgi:hypothetical protein
MFSERLSSVYTGMEEKYYSLLDFLDKKGVPVYAYNDFLEEKGLPAFPITIALLVLIVALLYGLFFVGGSIDPAITIGFSDQFNEPVSNVTLTVEDSLGNLVRSPSKISNGETLTLQGIPLGTELVLIAEKNGFQKAEQRIPVSKRNIPVSISMQKDVEGINATVQLLDSETSDPIRGASVTAEWQGSTRAGTSDVDGKVELAGIQSNTEILIVVEADGYETSRENYTFLDGENKGISLVANSASFQGLSRLIVSVEDEEGMPVQGAKVILKDNQNDTSIEERTLEESEGIFSASKGTSVRLIIEKEGFLTYDSLDFGETRTMRQDEEIWPVILAKGGSRLVITIFVGQSPLSDATVQLYDLNGNLKAEDITGFGGTAEITGLSPEEFFVTAYKQGYLPTREKTNVASTEKISLTLEPADTTNSSYLGISVLDPYMASAANANLKFFERSLGQEVPLGIPSLETDLTGYASIAVRPGTVTIIEAEKDLQTGIGEKTIEANKDNQLVIELSRPVNVLELQVLDEEGNPVAGIVSIESISGELLYDDMFEDGRLFFDTGGNKDVMVRIESLDGETFTQRLSVEGKETAQINLGEAATGVAPEVEFTGILNDLGEPAEGLVPGKDYWLAFQASFPTGVEKGGFHIRMGSDSTAFVDSQPAGITGFEAATPNFFYGTSFQPLPSPGSETADRQNAGTAGSLNKLLELYFEKPANTVAFTVRVRARELSGAEEVELHYRGWSEAGGKIFRFPEDTELGESSFTAEKTSLYAETQKATVKVFSSEASCDQDLCGNYYFVLPNGLYIDKQDFTAVADNLYSLQIELNAKKPLNVTLKLDTDKASPKIEFTGYDVDEFIDQQEATEQEEIDLSAQGYLYWPEGGEEAQQNPNPLGFSEGSGSTSLTVTGLGVSPDRSRKVRVYFRATAEGKAEIKMQAASDSVLNEEFVFEVQRNRPLHVTIEPREIEVGEPFTIRVMDGEDGTSLQEATVQIKDSTGEIVKTLVGRGSTRRGLNGEYYFKDLESGFYTANIHVKGYKSFEQEFLIVSQNLLSTVDLITIDIPKGSREKTRSFSMDGRGKAFSGISYELEKESGFPKEFAVSVTLPESISAGQDLTGSIRAIVNLTGESEEHITGEADLILKGNIEGRSPTQTEIRVKINYNRPLPEDCLKVTRGPINMRVLGRAGSSAVEEVEVENKCGQDLTLRATAEAIQTDRNIRVTVQTLRIKNNDVEKLKITASNTIERMEAMYSRRDFRIKLESDQLSKTIPLRVEIDNPQFNLSYPPSVALWMVRNAADERAYAQVPFHVMNNGPIPIYGLRIAVNPEAYMQGITAEIRPSVAGSFYSPDYYSDGYSGGTYGGYGGRGYDNYSSGGYRGYSGGGYRGYNNSNYYSGITLGPGEALSPMRYVYAETKKTEALQRPGQGWIEFFGTVGGRQRPLGRAALSINYSGTKCLKAESAEDPIIFSSRDVSQGTLEREISVTNECGEPVRLTGTIKPKMVSGNSFVSSPPNVVLNAGQTQTFKLILIKGAETDRTATVKVVGLLTRQNQGIESNEIRVTLRLGEKVATADGKATSEVEVTNCEDGKPKQRMAFPLLSEDCSQGYCDAKQLAEFLAKKAETAAKMAEDKIRRANNRKESFGKCTGTGHCSFDQMGILTDRFPVYLQLDFMTEEVLREALQKTSELKGYDVIQGSKAVENIGNVGFSLGNIYLGGSFKGCGKYYVTIDGAAMADDTGEIRLVSQKNFMIILNIDTARATTAECKHLVQNVSNFLPVDQGFTRLEHRHAWPGLVEAGSEFEKLAEAFAKELFGKADGRHAANISATSNKLEIVKGGLEADELLRISIKREEEGSSADKPKTVQAHVPTHYSETNTELAGEIAKAFATFKANEMENACWGENEEGQYIAMKGYSDIDKLYGKLEISSKDNAIRINNGEQCIELNVTSKVSEAVSFDLGLEWKGEYVAGIKKIVIFSEGRGELVKLEPGTPKDNKAEGKRELHLEKDETPGVQQHKAEFKLCVEADEHFPLAAQNIQAIKITANGSATTNRKASYQVGLEACGIHPKQLAEKITEREKSMDNGSEETYYALLGWKGAPEPPNALNLTKFRRMLALQAEIDEEGPSGFGTPITGLSSYEKKMQNYRVGAVGAYFSACAVPAFFTPWASVLFDCALPAVWGLADIHESTEKAKDTVIDWTKSVLGPLAKAGVAPIVNGISKMFGGEGSWDPTAGLEVEEYVGEDAAEESFQSILEGSLTFSGTKSIIEGLSAAGTKTSLSSARALVGSRLWKDFANEFVDNKVKGLPSSISNSLKDELAKNAKKTAQHTLFDSSLNPLTGRVHYTGLKAGVRGMPLDDIAKVALDKSFSESQKEFDGILGKVWDGTLSGRGMNPTEIAKLRSNMVVRKDQIFNTTQIGSDVTSKISNESIEVLATGSSREIRQEIADQILLSLETNNKEIVEDLMTKVGGRDRLLARIKRGVNLRGAPTPPADLLTTVTRASGTPGVRPRDVWKIAEGAHKDEAAKHLSRVRGFVDRKVRESVTTFSRNNADDIYEALQKTINEELVQKLGTSYADDITKLAKKAARKPGAFTRLGRFFKGLGLGAAAGIATNFVGLAAHSLYWKGVGPSPVESEAELMASELIEVLDEEGDVIGEKEVLADIKLFKHQSYKITLLNSIEGKFLVNIVPIKTDEQFEEMSVAIKKNPESNWNVDCISYATEEIDLLLGKLKPTAGGNVKTEHAIAYHKNEEIIRYFSKHYGIAEELIMAVLLEQPEKIKECGIEAEWYNKDFEEDERNRIVGCATKRLHDALEKKLPLSSFSNSGNKGAYVKKIQEIKSDWAKFRVKDAS